MVNNFQASNRNANFQQARKDFTRYPTVPQNFQNTSVCANCGKRWSQKYHQFCPANGKKCNNCEIFGHFAQECRKPQKLHTQTPKPLQPNVNQTDTNTTKSNDEESVNCLTSYQQLYNHVYDSNYDSDSDDYVADIFSDTANQLERFNEKCQYGSILANSMIDSGSVCGLITKTLADRILKTATLARWATTKQDKNPKHIRMNWSNIAEILQKQSHTIIGPVKKFAEQLWRTVTN